MLKSYWWVVGGLVDLQDFGVSPSPLVLNGFLNSVGLGWGWA